MDKCVLHVLGLPGSADEDTVRRLFFQFGTVISARIVKDLDDNSLGFAVVEMSSIYEVNEILNTQDRLQIGGKRLQVWRRPENYPRLNLAK
jgi:RNA recognition motif-containing protein